MSAKPVQRPITHVYDGAYSGVPNWDIGRPQRAFVELADAGLIRNPVLDVGCGTGELSLYLARQGFDVLGIDLSSLAVQQARQKAYWRDIEADFLVWDASNLTGLRDGGLSFRTVVDSGMFHLLSDRERDRFVHGLDAVVVSGGLYCVLGDARHDDHAIYGITPEELRARFNRVSGWEVVFADDAVYERRWRSNPGYFIGVRKR